MAVTITNDFTVLYTGDVSFAGSTTYSGFQRFGTACNGEQVSNGTDHYFDTVPSYSLVGSQIFSWMVGPGSIGTLTQGGYRIVIGDGTNTRAYYVGGRDTKNFSSEGWFCFILNGDNLPTQFEQLNGAAQPNLSNLTQVGVGFTTTSKATGNSPNCFYDVARYGTGLTISGGTTLDPGEFKEIFLEDSSIDNAWGVIEELGEGVFGIQGKLIFGSTNSDTYFMDSNKTIVYTNRPVSTTFLEISLLGSSTNNNTFILGEELTSGGDTVGINGVSIISPNTNVNIDLSAANFDVVDIFGSVFNSIGSSDIILSNNILHNFISNTINSSGMLISNSMVIRNLIVSGTNGSASLLWNPNTDIKNSNFIGNSTAILYDDPTGTPFTYDNLLFTGNTIDIQNNSGLEITINAFNGSNPVSTAGDNVIINNPTIFRVTNLIPNTEVRIFRQDNRVELAGVESSTDEFTYEYNYVGDIIAYLVVHKETYEYIKIRDILLDENDQTITVQQRFDRNYISS